MDAAGALALMNAELKTVGCPPLVLDEVRTQRAFQTLRAYAATAEVPLEIAVRHFVTFELQTQILKEGVIQ